MSEVLTALAMVAGTLLFLGGIGTALIMHATPRRQRTTGTHRRDRMGKHEKNE